MDKLTHVDDEGKLSMVDVSGKPVQRRTARASGHIQLAPETIAMIRDNRIKKGEVLTVARLAGIQAAKQTGQFIPLCHPLTLDHIDVQATLCQTGLDVHSEVTCTGRTGVEMEALTGVSVALLTIYDMCKAVDKSMRIGDIQLTEKQKQNA